MSTDTNDATSCIRDVVPHGCYGGIGVYTVTWFIVVTGNVAITIIF